MFRRSSREETIQGGVNQKIYTTPEICIQKLIHHKSLQYTCLQSTPILTIEVVMMKIIIRKFRDIRLSSELQWRPRRRSHVLLASVVSAEGNGGCENRTSYGRIPVNFRSPRITS